MKHEKTVNVPIYGGEITIIFTDELGVMEDKFGDWSLSYIYAHHLNRGEENVIAFNFWNKDFEDITHGTIAHEVHHCVNSICDRLGILVEYRIDEPTAYLTAWITDEIYSFMKDKKLKAK